MKNINQFRNNRISFLFSAIILFFLPLISNAQLKVSSTGGVEIGSATAPASGLLVNTGDINLNSASNSYQINGSKILWYNNSANIFVGVGAGTNTTGLNNTFIGKSAGNANIIGSSNTALGTDALILGTSSQTTAIGAFSMTHITSANSNTAVGYATLNLTTSGGSNTALGWAALYSNTTGQLNTATGKQSLNSNTIGGNNCATGYYSLFANTSGSSNTSVGSYSLQNNSTGTENTGVGYLAGTTNTTGTNNTCIGYNANVSAGALTNATALGNGATVTASNNMWFGNTAVVGWGFGVAPGAAAIRVGTGVTNGNGANLTLGGAWTNGSSMTFKDNITQLDGADVLKKIAQLEVARWKYKETNEYHIGPFAEQFYELFNTGVDKMYISTIDPSGVALVGIKELIKQNERQEQIIEEQATAIKSQDAAIKAQDSKIESLQNQISNCCSNIQQISNGNNATTGNTNGNGINDLLSSTAMLYQNVPNPFNQQTSIEYFIPTNSQSASIMVFDLNGKLMNTIQVSSFGKGAIVINGSQLSPGMFVYSLIVDQKIIDTKRMILTN